GEARIQRGQLVFHLFTLSDVAQHADELDLLLFAAFRRQFEVDLDPGDRAIGAGHPEGDGTGRIRRVELGRRRQYTLAVIEVNEIEARPSDQIVAAQAQH